MTYQEQLKSPKWQRKRLEIMERDDFKCRCCKNTDTELQVHHLYYLPKHFIWEYDNDGMVTVCKNCHNILNIELGKLSGHIAFDIFVGKLNVLNNE
jgi:5-methylcytosine-specific restriction endonuclease McrA